MNTNIKYKNGTHGVKWFADYSAARNFFFNNRNTIAAMSDRFGNRV